MKAIIASLSSDNSDAGFVTDENGIMATLACFCLIGSSLTTSLMKLFMRAQLSRLLVGEMFSLMLEEESTRNTTSMLLCSHLSEVVKVWSNISRSKINFKQT